MVRVRLGRGVNVDVRLGVVGVGMDGVVVSTVVTGLVPTLSF